MKNLILSHTIYTFVRNYIPYPQHIQLEELMLTQTKLISPPLYLFISTPNLLLYYSCFCFRQCQSPNSRMQPKLIGVKRYVILKHRPWWAFFLKSLSYQSFFKNSQNKIRSPPSRNITHTTPTPLNLSSPLTCNTKRSSHQNTKTSENSFKNSYQPSRKAFSFWLHCSIFINIHLSLHSQWSFIHLHFPFTPKP
jgi:hypothetical protein